MPAPVRFLAKKVPAATVSDFSLSFGPLCLSPKRRVQSWDGKSVRLGGRPRDSRPRVENGKERLGMEDLLKALLAWDRKQ